MNRIRAYVVVPLGIVCLTTLIPFKALYHSCLRPCCKWIKRGWYKVENAFVWVYDKLVDIEDSIGRRPDDRDE